MIRRLHELQSQEANSQCSPAETAQVLPQDRKAETTQTSGVFTDPPVNTEEQEESSEPSQLGSALRNGGVELFRTSADSSLKETQMKLSIMTSCSSREEDRNKQPASSSWSEMSSVLIGSEYSLSPLSRAMEQRLILQYLSPLGDYQEVRVSPRHCSFQKVPEF